MAQIDSLLAKSFIGVMSKDIEQEVLIDSNPKSFEVLIDYLIYGEEGVAPDENTRLLLKREMDYWGIKPR